MSEPWFRRYAGFSYRPVTWQGRIVVAAMAVVAIPLGIASLTNVFVTIFCIINYLKLKIITLQSFYKLQTHNKAR